MRKEQVIVEFDTAYNHYRVADTYYNGRPARLLYVGSGEAALSGLALDDNPELLFDYNQRFLELVGEMRSKRVLLLGGGAFTLPRALTRDFPDLALDVVEIDPMLVTIAKCYFGFVPNQHTHVYVGDGRDYLDTVRTTYDTIILDVFQGTTIPSAFQARPTGRLLYKRLTRRGIVAINIISSLHGFNATVFHRVGDMLGTAFHSVHVFPAGPRWTTWLPDNYVLTAQKRAEARALHLRYQPVALG